MNYPGFVLPEYTGQHCIIANNLNVNVADVIEIGTSPVDTLYLYLGAYNDEGLQRGKTNGIIICKDVEEAGERGIDIMNRLMDVSSVRKGANSFEVDDNELVTDIVYEEFKHMSEYLGEWTTLEYITASVFQIGYGSRLAARRLKFSPEQMAAHTSLMMGVDVEYHPKLGSRLELTPKMECYYVFPEGGFVYFGRISPRAKVDIDGERYSKVMRPTNELYRAWNNDSDELIKWGFNVCEKTDDVGYSPTGNYAYPTYVDEPMQHQIEFDLGAKFNQEVLL